MFTLCEEISAAASLALTRRCTRRDLICHFQKNVSFPSYFSSPKIPGEGWCCCWNSFLFGDSGRPSMTDAKEKK